MVKPEAGDKRCAAKIEILKALCKLQYPSPSLFRRAMRHIQMEPSWGGPVDTAAEVRALGAMGLAQTDYTEVQEEIVPCCSTPSATTAHRRGCVPSRLPDCPAARCCCG